MLKRSLVFTSPATLSLKDAQLVITLKEQPGACRTVPIEELGVVLVDNPMVSLTIPLINALADGNVALIFCDQKGMPNALTLSLHANASQGESYREQITASETLKKALWKQLVEAKIRNQARLLSKQGKRGSYESMDVHIKRVKSLAPNKGMISILVVTDKQYSNIVNVWGEVAAKQQPKPIQLELF